MLFKKLCNLISNICITVHRPGNGVLILLTFISCNTLYIRPTVLQCLHGVLDSSLVYENVVFILYVGRWQLFFSL